MDRSKIIEAIGRKRNRNLQEWYESKVQELARIIVSEERKTSERVQTSRVAQK